MGSAAGKPAQGSTAFGATISQTFSSRPQSRSQNTPLGRSPNTPKGRSPNTPQGRQQRAPQDPGHSGRSSSRLSFLSLDEYTEDNMVCESCSANFTIFKRKNRCLDCSKLFCTNCMHKDPRKCCKTCHMFAGSKDRTQLMQFKVKDLRQYLAARDIPTIACREKGELVDLVVQYWSTRNGGAFMVTVNNLEDPAEPVITPPASSQPEARWGGLGTTRTPAAGATRPPSTGATRPPSTGATRAPAPGAPSPPAPGPPNPPAPGPQVTASIPQARPEPPVPTEVETDTTLTRNTWTEGSSASDSEADHSPVTPEENPSTATPTPEQPKQAPVRHRASISDLKTIDDITDLTVRQLKEILTLNFINYKGCVERWELEERVRRLYNEKESLKVKEQAAAANADSDAANSAVAEASEDDICRICMDSSIDCVLLECGHMVTCTKCGKQLAECPMCRQYIIRVVHVFRS